MSANPSVNLMPAADSSTTALTTAQKLEALRRVQGQAEQRVKLGTQLLKAAEAHASQTHSHVEQIRQEQNELREKLEHDVAAALHQYDQWVGTIDESLTRRLQQTEERLDALDKQWEEAEQRMTRMVKRAELMFDQSRSLLESATSKLDRLVAIRPTPPAAMPALKIDGPILQTEAEIIDAADADDTDDAGAAAPSTMLYSHLMNRLRERGDEAPKEDVA